MRAERTAPKAYPLTAALVACLCIALSLPVGPASASSGGSGAGPALTGPLARESVRSQQWQLQTLGMTEAWTRATGEGVTVAVVDSGVDADHIDLQGQVLKGRDFVDPSGDGDTDLVGHGTTVSGIIAGRDDASGVVGIAPHAKILPVRVLDRENRYDDAEIVADGVRWAVDNGARVINLSLGGTGTSAALAAAIDYAFAADVVVVACTGNASASTSTNVWYPAREPGVIAVAGMERDGVSLWSGSITGKETVVTAPATELVGARPDNEYWRVQGTSFAAPMVSATAALIRSRWPTMPAGEVVNRIIKTAEDRGPAGRDAEFGYGLINPTAALTAELPGILRNPLDTTASPGKSRLGSAPAPGQAQAAPDDAGTSTPGARAPGSNAGTVVASSTTPSDPARTWWAAAGLFLLSLLATIVIVRRFAHT